MITLGVDTSAAVGGVALCDGDETLADMTMEAPLRHAEELLPLVEHALKRGGIRINDVKLVSVNRGPGSFTGLRIGLATAKGICQARGIPLVGVDGLRAFRVRIESHLRVCVVLKNRRDLYYVQWFVGDTPTQAVSVMSGDDVARKIYQEKRRLYLIGSGVDGLRDRLRKCAWVECASDELNRQSPVWVARLGEQRFSQDQLYDLEPTYVEPVLAKMSKQL
jgi:tRNA threonylcarbamoyladenosine biosynthesis protein TsaB